MGNPFVHFELSTDDVAKAKKFYQSLFDWKIKDVPAMKYTLIDFGSKTSGGGMQAKQMPQQPTAWLAYVEVADVKKTVAKAEKAGGKIMLPYLEVGDGMGAIGIFADPTGAAIGVWAKGKPAPKKAAAKKKPAAKPKAKAKAKAKKKK